MTVLCSAQPCPPSNVLTLNFRIPLSSPLYSLTRNFRHHAATVSATHQTPHILTPILSFILTAMQCNDDNKIHQSPDYLNNILYCNTATLLLNMYHTYIDNLYLYQY